MDPASLVMIDIEAQTLVDSFVGLFGGTISLGVEYKQHLQLDASQGCKGGLEMGNKKFVIVGDYF